MAGLMANGAAAQGVPVAPRLLRPKPTFEALAYAQSEVVPFFWTGC